MGNPVSPPGTAKSILRCCEVAEATSRLIDGELELRARLKVKFHFATCRGCRAFADQMRVTRDLMRTASVAPVPLPSGEIRAALEKRRRHSARR